MNHMTETTSHCIGIAEKTTMNLKTVIWVASTFDKNVHIESETVEIVVRNLTFTVLMLVRWQKATSNSKVNTSNIVYS